MIDLDMNEIGHRIRSARRKMHWTQQDLAKKLNVSDAAIGLWENGQRTINFETLYKLCDVFDLPRSYFLSEDPDDFSSLSAAESERLKAMRSDPQLGTVLDLAKQMRKDDVKKIIDIMELIPKAESWIENS